MKISKSIKKKVILSLSLILRILITYVIAIAIYYIIAIFFEETISDLVYSLNYDLYAWIVHNRNILFYIFIAIVLSIIVYMFVAKYVNGIEKVYSSLDKILKEDSEVVELPDTVSQFAEKINNIKYNYIMTKKSEKEAEQKKNDLIMYMAHDLKTPLTSIIGYLTLLSEEKNISKELREKYIKIALDKSLRVEELTNQFFDITRYDLHSMPINKKEINLVYLLEQLIDECYPMLEKNNLKYNLYSPEKIMYMGDGDKLARAFDNLLKNAINYSYIGTTIEIYIEEKEDKIFISFKNKGDKIPKYKLDKLFEKFYRADDARQSSTGGAGLGLAITKEIIELHNGKISVKNDDEFIEFDIYL